MRTSRRELLREIPAVGRLLDDPRGRELIGRFPRAQVARAIAAAAEGLRRRVQQVPDEELASLEIGSRVVLEEAAARLSELERAHLTRVLNATGVVVHTNLGRSVLAEEAVEALAEAARGYSNLEFDLEAGRRGSRHSHLEEVLCRITGAEAAMAVNNNAAAVFLVLHTLAHGRQVPISRGQLVEIGGSFRIPEVMLASGAILVEVGTTNKTHLADYEAAIREETAFLLKVHQSNYRIVGFTQDVPLPELVQLAHSRGLPVVEDLGSGVLVELGSRQVAPEPTVQSSIRDGADLVTFSGDKLLGGPQAGIIVGRRELVERLKRDHLARALRVDKLTIAALEATLRLYLRGEAWERIPTLRMLGTPPELLRRRASRLARALGRALGEAAQVRVLPGASRPGGGSLPAVELPTSLVEVTPRRITAAQLAERLRHGAPPLVGRVQHDGLLLDLRTIDPKEEAPLVRVMREAAVGDPS